MAADRSRSAVSRFFRNPSTGEVVVAQLPNLPLAAFLLAEAVKVVARPDGAARTAVTVVVGAALVWWSVDEMVRGESAFRRVLGAVVLVGWAVSLLLR
jgi:hypothetical protein